MTQQPAFKPEPILTDATFKQHVLNLSPLHLMRVLMVSVFVVELAIMLTLEPLIFDPDATFIEILVEGTLDATLLAILVFPILYYYAFKPLVEVIGRYQRTEKALDTANNFLEIVFASLTDGVIVVNSADDTILSCNRTAEKLLGFPQTKMRGQPVSRFLATEQNPWPPLRQKIEATLSNGNIFRLESELHPRQELKYTAEITVNRVEAKNESSLQVYVVRDISERIKSQQQLQLQTTALEAAANGIMITNNKGLIEWVNPALTEMTGFSFEKLIGQDASIFNSGQHQPETFATMWQAIQSGQVWSGELINRRLDNSVYIENQSIAPVRNKHGEITHYIAIKQDITERKQAEIQMARHNQELVMLGQLGQSVVSSLELPKIFTDVIDQVTPLVGAECLSILLRKGNRLAYVATAGLDSDTFAGMHASLHEGVPGEVMRTGRALSLTEGDGDGRFDIASTCACKPKSLLAVPLALGQKRLGLIQAAHRQANAFDDDSIRALTAAANWAAIAISHAHQLEEIRHRLNETATLAAINQSLNETLDLDNILQLIADSTPRLLTQADGVVIHMLDEQEGYLMPTVWSGDTENDLSDLFLSLDTGLADEVFRSGKLVNLPDVQQSTYATIFSGKAPASLVIAPLQSGRFQLGTITIQNQSQPHVFSSQDERLLMRLADSAAVAINTARLYQSEKIQRQQAEHLARAAVALSQSLEMDAVLATIINQTVAMVDCTETAVFLLRDGEIYRTRHSHPQNSNGTLPPTLQKLLNQEYLSDELPPLELIMDTGKPVLIAENHQENLTNLAFAQLNQVALGPTALVAAPLRITHDTSGFLVVQSDKPANFDRNTMRRLELLASQASLAVQNALLFDDLGKILQKEQSTRAQLVQAQKLSAMGRMVASVAHELNNPLQTIKNCLFLIQQDVANAMPMQTYLEMALSETNRLTNLVLQLRDVYRQASSNVQNPVSLPDVISQVHLILREHLKQNNIVYLFEPAHKPLWVLGDANQLKQVVINICLNAIDAMTPDGGQLTLSLVTNQDEIGLVIQDTGIGIRPEDKEKLFEPFFTKKDNGTGLGLAICYDIVQKHGGNIAVASKPGNGATFTIWLPVLPDDEITEE
ncbi:MAG: GAF domain-containing protein [Candidatus Promineifilaceae bacterium]